jgi:diguanylate cyclase (GGDEF)-like protein
MTRLRGVVGRLEAQTRPVMSLARMDGLTGVPNRRAWDTELPVALDVARRDQTSVSIALLDLDHFKRFNDEYGHPSGDRLLKSAAAWHSALRSVDLLCRYGGEEFAVILPGATEADAAQIIDRLRRVTPLGQTFSAGIAGWDTREGSEQLVERADQALYIAKAAGRDRVVTATSGYATPRRQTACGVPALDCEVGVTRRRSWRLAVVDRRGRNRPVLPVAAVGLAGRRRSGVAGVARYYDFPFLWSAEAQRDLASTRRQPAMTQLFSLQDEFAARFAAEPGKTVVRI